MLIFGKIENIDGSSSGGGDYATLADLATKVTKELDGTNIGDKAKIQNQTDGGVMQYVSADKSNSAVTVNDGSQDVGAEICSLDPDGNGSRIIANKTGAYYSVGNAVNVTPEKEIAVKGDLDKYILVNNDQEGNKSYMANEKDGGIIKYIKPDESYAKVTLCNVDEEAVAQIVATDKDKAIFAKIDARKEGICYSKKPGNPNLVEDELVVKKDLEPYATRVELDDYTTDSDFNILKTQIQTTYITKDDVDTNYLKKLDALNLCPMAKAEELEARIAALEGGGA